LHILLIILLSRRVLSSSNKREHLGNSGGFWIFFEKTGFWNISSRNFHTRLGPNSNKHQIWLNVV
jgi:hypothetical protein